MCLHIQSVMLPFVASFSPLGLQVCDAGTLMRFIYLHFLFHLVSHCSDLCNVTSTENESLHTYLTAGSREANQLLVSTSMHELTDAHKCHGDEQGRNSKLPPPAYPERTSNFFCDIVEI